MKADKITFVIILLSWFAIATVYLSHTAYNDRQHDIEGHIQNTQIIISEHRFPTPYESFEGSQPPLYYLINSFIEPVSLTKEELNILFDGKCPERLKKHINYVQALSVFYGAITLVLIGWILSFVTQSKIAQILALLFIATTPKFVFVFSTYNSDSIATMISVAIIAICYKLHLKWSWKLAATLLAIATVGMYTKHTVVFCMAAIFFICCRSFFVLRTPRLVELRIISIILLSMILFLPWMIFHYYRHTGYIYAFTSSHQIRRKFSFHETLKSFRTIIKVPLLQQTPHEWDDPWSHPFPDFSATKTSDHFSFSFITSIIGEFKFTFPPEKFIWALLFVHLFTNIGGLLKAFRSNISKLATSFVLLNHFSYLFPLLTIIKSDDMVGMQDYRYICCSWIAWAILYSSVISSNKSYWSWMLRALMIVGIIMHIYFLKTVTGSDI